MLERGSADVPMPTPPRRPLVLLVEDSDDDAFLFSRTLRLAGFKGQVVHLSDGGVAIAYLEQVLFAGAPVPDLVFLDLKIPTFSGFEVLEWVRTQQFPRPLEIDVLSGSDDTVDRARALQLGAATYYTKPVVLPQLEARLARWIESQADRSKVEVAGAGTVSH